jgi:hypothetical protein
LGREREGASEEKKETMMPLFSQFDAADLVGKKAIESARPLEIGRSS